MQTVYSRSRETDSTDPNNEIDHDSDMDENTKLALHPLLRTTDFYFWTQGIYKIRKPIYKRIRHCHIIETIKKNQGNYFVIETKTGTK